MSEGLNVATGKTDEVVAEVKEQDRNKNQDGSSDSEKGLLSAVAEKLGFAKV